MALSPFPILAQNSPLHCIAGFETNTPRHLAVTGSSSAAQHGRPEEAGVLAIVENRSGNPDRSHLKINYGSPALAAGIRRAKADIRCDSLDLIGRGFHGGGFGRK